MSEKKGINKKRRQRSLLEKILGLRKPTPVIVPLGTIETESTTTVTNAHRPSPYGRNPEEVVIGKRTDYDPVKGK